MLSLYSMGMPESGQSVRMRNWNEQQRAEWSLYALAPRFEAAGLPLAPVKGLALGRWLYDDPADRGMRDLDLLIAPTQFASARALVRSSGWPVLYDSGAQRELLFMLDGFAVEIHGEIGRRDLTGIDAGRVLARARRDASSFRCPVLRIDDIDHFLLLAANVVKDRFTHANPHQARDLTLLWARLEAREDELVRRAEACGFGTGIRAVARWMAERHHDRRFSKLVARFEPGRRRAQGRALELLSRYDSPFALGLAVACWTNDRLSVRTRCMRQLVTRGLRVR
jgi:hypothetical protein